MGDVITTTLLILLAIALIVVAVVGIKHILRYFLNGVKETWDLSGQIGPIGHGLLVAGWIFFFPFALVITVITGWSKTRTLTQNTSADLLSNHQSLMARGESVNSSIENPYKVELYPGVQVSLPVGTWKILREQDFAKSGGTVMLNAILDGDREYTSRYLNTKTLQPQFIWIFDASDPPNFMQITVVDVRFEDLITKSNLDQQRKMLKKYHSKTKTIEHYSLELDQMNISDWGDLSLIEQLTYRDKSHGKDWCQYSIDLQKKPFCVIFSCTFHPESSDRYTDLTLKLAKSYQTQ